ncbi:MAG: hypothetical protein ACEQSQ_06615 [Candidatus Paceibacteria bacterium]
MESVLNYIHDKIDSYEVQIIKDEFDERKSYIVENGFILGVQINTGTKIKSK